MSLQVPARSSVSALIVLLLQLLVSVNCEQLRPYYNDGNFTFPAQVVNDTNVASFPGYDIGTQMTVRWNTTYKSCNLFYAQYGDTGDSQQLASGLIANNYVWNPIKVVYTNLSQPFHFRCVDPSNPDQTGSGFWSASFFLRDRDAGSNTSSLALTGSSPTASTTSRASSGASISGGAIAGIAIGAAAGLALVAVGVFFFLRRFKKGKFSELDAQQSAHMYPPNGQYPLNGYYNDENGNGYYSGEPKYTSQLYGSSAAAEMPAQDAVVELPDQNRTTFELPTSPTAHSRGQTAER